MMAWIEVFSADSRRWSWCTNKYSGWLQEIAYVVQGL